MVSVPLGVRQRIRTRADLPPIEVVNRFFEENPQNMKEQVALIERPTLQNFLEAGEGPGRRLYAQPGFSNGDLFHVSGGELYKHHMNINRTVTTSQIAGLIDGEGAPDLAATYEHLWITDGITLQYTNGTAALVTVPTPDNIPFISLDVYNDYVICVQSESDRFYWIEPGEVTIDALNFATAERSPDWLLQVRTVGDLYWLLGQGTTEVWRATGDPDAPMMRIEGRLFDRGSWGGTATRIKDSVVVVGDDGMIYDVQGAPVPISDPGIAELVRDAMKTYRGD